MTILVLSTALFGLLAWYLSYTATKYYKWPSFKLAENQQLIWILIFITGVLLRAGYVLHPVDTESWRENDISLIAKNYLENGMNFFYPQVNWGNGPGYVESEFPLYPYLIAVWYKTFGFYEPAGRIISLIFSIATLLIFFRLSAHLFSAGTALFVSLLFSLSPLPSIISTAIQSESMMFFFYLCSVYYFIKWIDKPSPGLFFMAAISTAFAILLKVTAAQVGILFLLLIVLKKNWKYLFEPKILLFGFICLAPSVLWYFYSHQFYLEYGNSLGISNEYSFMGTDFFTDPYFIKGIFKLEIEYVWFYSGILLTALAIIFTNIVKQPAFIFAGLWLVSAFIFYMVASRTTADYWAYYYHIFSSPAAAIIVGFSLIKLREKYLDKINKVVSNLNSIELKRGITITGSVAFLLILVVHSYLNNKSLINNKEAIFKTSGYYNSLKEISKIIPSGTSILASGDACNDKKGYPVAYNSSYFFYWLNCKGYNICTQEQSIQKLKEFRERGINYFIAETWALSEKKGFTEELKQAFEVVYEDKGLMVFRL